MKRAALLLAIAAALVPGVASADFLYNAIPPDRMPYVFVIMDNSFSMNQSDVEGVAPPPYGLRADGSPASRIDAAKEALRAVLDDVEGVGVGFIHFYPNGRSVDMNGVNGSDPTKPGYNPADPAFPSWVMADLAHSEAGRACGACLITYPDGVNDRQLIIDELAVMKAETDTALAVSVTFAAKMIKRVAKGYTLGGPNGSTVPNETPDTAADEHGLDQQLQCRRYYVILMTDGDDTCTDVRPLAGLNDPIFKTAGGAPLPIADPLCVAASAGAVPECALRAGRYATVEAIAALRNLDLGGGDKKMVATFIIGFGKKGDANFKTTLARYAKEGRSTYDPDTKKFACMAPNGSFGDPGALPCTAAVGGDPDATNNGAIMAYNTVELRNAFRLAFDAALAGEFVGSSPIIYTVPQEVSELGRVSRNFLAYGAFRMPRSKGVLYGIRLYKESATTPGVFEFTNLISSTNTPPGPLNLADVNAGTHYGIAGSTGGCGAAANPCTFEAGELLTRRMEAGTKHRRIFTADVDNVQHTGSGLTGSTFVYKNVAVPIPHPDDPVAALAKGIPVNTWNRFMDQVVPAAIGGGGLSLGDSLDALPAGLLAQGTSKFNTIDSKLHTFYRGTGTKPSDAFHKGVSAWLHAVPPPASSPAPADVTTWHLQGRSWALGDILHSSVAIVGSPGNGSTAAGYATFRNSLANRPPMIYVGANDGMIHAFYAAPDLQRRKDSLAERWEAGEEAWAFLPPSQFANTAYNVLLGNSRFESQDLSCRVDDILVDPAAYGPGADCSGDTKLCGWRTVLLCGQGWGGNWYTAIDITWPDFDAVATWEPKPVPMWEFTNFTGKDAMAAPEDMGLGRTWSLPGLGMVNLEPDGLRTIAVFGNGYNSSQRTCEQLKNAQECEPGTTEWNMAWAWLNLPYQFSVSSKFPRSGEGVDGDVGNIWAIDVASGLPLKKFTQPEMGAVLADVPVIDSDGDRLLEAAYPASWGAKGKKTSVGRIFFPTGSVTGAPSKTEVSTWGICPVGQPIVDDSNRPFTISPAVFRHPYKRNVAFLFAGTGVEKEAGQQHPDLERFGSSGNDWTFYGRVFNEDGSAKCGSDLDIQPVCPGTGAGTQKFELGKTNPEERLVGAPTIVRQANGKDWLLFTTMTPPASFCAAPQTFLWCMDVTNPQGCLLCGDLDGTVGAEQSTEVPGAPTSPATADGQIYTVGGDGPVRSTPGGTGDPATTGGGNNQSGTNTAPGGGAPAGPNQLRPRYLPVSFREIF